MNVDDDDSVQIMYHLLKCENNLLKRLFCNSPEKIINMKINVLQKMDEFNQSNTGIYSQVDAELFPMFYLMANIRRLPGNQELTYDDLYQNFYGMYIIDLE